MSTPVHEVFRQLEVFDPRTFHHDCHVIGDGASGSEITQTLARLRFPRVHVYDPDVVKEHNLGPQRFARDQVGLPKVTASAREAERISTTEVIAHQDRVGPTHRFKGVVFVCVSDMDTRRMLWQSCLKRQLDIPLLVETRMAAEQGQPDIPFVVETRMAAEQGRIYALDPGDELHVERWEADSNYPSGHQEGQPCTYWSCPTTAMVLAAIAVHQVTLWHRGLDYAHRTIFGLKGPPLFQVERWE